MKKHNDGKYKHPTVYLGSNEKHMKITTVKSWETPYDEGSALRNACFMIHLIMPMQMRPSNKQLTKIIKKAM